MTAIQIWQLSAQLFKSNEKTVIYNIFSFIIFFLGIYIYSNQQLNQLKGSLVTDKQFTKRLNITQIDNLNFIYYSDKIKNLLQQTPETKLLNIKCSDGIIRTIDGAYVFENEKTGSGEKRLIKNTKFIEFMRNKEPGYPPGKRLLASRVCEIENRFLLIFYTIGSYDTKTVEGLSPRLLVLNSGNNESILQIINNQTLTKSNKLINLGVSKKHMRCDQPFQFYDDGSLIILCSEKDEYISTYRTYKLNINNGSGAILETCINKYKDGLNTFCQ